MDQMEIPSQAEEVQHGSAPTPVKTKSPGLAFLFSLVLPGAGQLYCGKHVRGGWTLFFSVVSLIGTGFLLSIEGSETEAILGIFLRTGIFLYVFAFLDAFFTAREINDGTDIHIVENPRVAAILNLVTRGFGYFYIGEKKKGVIIFILMGILSRVSMRMDDSTLAIGLEIVLEVIMAALAADAYRLASKLNQERMAAQPSWQQPLQPETGLPSAVPLAFGGLFALSYAGLLTLGLLYGDTPDFTVIDRSLEALTESEESKVYSNPTYGIEMRIPAPWEFDQPDSEYFVEAQALGAGCSVGLILDTVSLFGTLESTAEDLRDTILTHNDNFQFLEQKPATLSGSAAIEVVFSADVDEAVVLQNYLLAQRGSIIYALIITTAEVFKETCHPDIQTIREGVVLPQ